MPRPRLPLYKRLIYGSVVFVAFLALLNKSLSLMPFFLDRSTAPTGPAVEGAASVVCLGDSVTYGSGVSTSQSYPMVLKKQLQDRGFAQADVFNLGHPAAGTLYPQQVAHGEGTSLRGYPGQLVILILIGHNDVTRWSKAPLTEEQLSQLKGSHSGNDTPLLRIWNWIAARWVEDLPEEALDPDASERYRTMLMDMRNAYPRARIYALTYANPGPPDTSVDPYAREVINRTRALQMQMNDIIRYWATTLRIPLIDLDKDLARPSLWSPDWYQDAIHLTPAGYEAMSTVIADRLILDDSI